MHQAPWPFRFSATSDHRFYDRFWFAGVDPNGGAGFLSGMAYYKNLHVCDGYGVVQARRRQHNARFSRPLDEDLVTTGVGDLDVEVREPFKRLALRWSGESTPLRADLEFTASFDPYCEEHYVDASTGRVTQEITRYNQIGTWNGWLDSGTGRVDVEDWWGVRDHSWGVRPGVGGMDRSVADPAANKEGVAPMLHFVLYCENGELSLCVSMREDEVGRRTYFDGEMIAADGTHDVVTDVELRATFHPGARTYDAVDSVVTTRSGRRFTVRATPLLEPWAYAGTGYDGGYADGGGLGVPRGRLVEHDVYELVPPEQVLLDGRPTPSGHREQFAVVELDGARTIGYCTVMTRGKLTRYGLD